MMWGLVEYYNELWELRDRRMDDWPLMSSVFPSLALVAAYIFLVKVWGPRHMRDRPAYDLKAWLQVHNFIQVALSGYVIYEACAAGWATHYSLLCQPVEKGSEPGSDAMRMAAVVYVYFISKFIEFIDTFFFVARKKFNQVSFLHVTHHGIMPLFAFALTRWLPGGHESFGGLLNSVVHFIMYSYYFVAALGPKYQKYLWWKRYLTTFQMIQFVTILTRSLIVVFGIVECDYPWQFSLLSAAIMIVFLVLFANFYIQSYLVKKPASSKKAQ